MPDNPIEPPATVPGAASSPPPSSDPPVRILLTSGVGRSGSTLLHRMLGQMPGCLSLGEASGGIWFKHLVKNQPCGCGLPFADCPFWKAVGAEAFGGWDNLDVDRVLSLQASVDRLKFVPLLAVPHQPKAFARRVDAYADLLHRLLRAVRTVSGAQLLVDSSKMPSTAYTLRRVPGVELTVVHLVRDPRGVAHSWSTNKATKAPASDRTGLMPKWPVRRAARRWLTANTAVEGLGLLGVQLRRVRYEDVVERPVEALRALSDILPPAPAGTGLSFIADGCVTLPSAHTCVGNVNRFETGPVRLRLDERWRTGMTSHDRRVVEQITLPLRGRYGYS